MLTASDRRKAFDEERDLHDRGLIVGQYVQRSDGWVLFGPKDVRDSKRKYQFSLQFLKDGRHLNVRAGCRHYTIEQAFKHWNPTRYRGWPTRRNQCQQARAIIVLMVAQARAYGLLSIYNEKIKFDLKLKPKPKRK